MLLRSAQAFCWLSVPFINTESWPRVQIRVRTLIRFLIVVTLACPPALLPAGATAQELPIVTRGAPACRFDSTTIRDSIDFTLFLSPPRSIPKVRKQPEQYTSTFQQPRRLSISYWPGSWADDQIKRKWQQWGNPSREPDYSYMKSYSPYDNVAARAYPAILVTAGLNDPRVGYWEPAKWVARLRAAKTDTTTLLLKTNMGAGHGGSSGRYDYLEEMAFRYAFILDQVRIHQP